MWYHARVYEYSCPFVLSLYRESSYCGEASLLNSQLCCLMPFLIARLCTGVCSLPFRGAVLSLCGSVSRMCMGYVGIEGIEGRGGDSGMEYREYSTWYSMGYYVV